MEEAALVAQLLCYRHEKSVEIVVDLPLDCRNALQGRGPSLP